MTPSRKPSAPKPVKAWAVVGQRGAVASVALTKIAAIKSAEAERADDWFCLLMRGYRCIRVTITPA